MSSRELLRDALAVWGATRADAIAEVIDRLTVQLSRGWEPPAPKLARTFHVAWLAAAADDLHRGWAARHVLAKLPDRSAAVRERLTALHAAGPDPRVGRALCQQLDQLAVLAPFAELGVQLLGECGDDVVRQALAASRPAAAPAVARVIDRVSAALATPRGRAPTAAELARFAPPVPTVELAALERDVYANPDDDEPRAVLADLLQARGDPRGELIALQLAVAAGRASDDGDARIEALVRDHGRAWLGPLAAIALRAELRRGFPARLELAGADRVDPARWESVVEERALATVEELIPGQCSGARYAELIASPASTALRRIEVFDAAVIRGLERTHARLVHVAVPSLDPQRPGRFLDGVLSACARFDTLRSVACELAMVPELMHSPIGSRLDTLIVGGEVRAVATLWRNLSRPLALVIAPHARLPACTRVDALGEGSIHLRRDAGRVIVRVAGPWGATAICDHWGAVPADRLELVEPIASATTARIAGLAGSLEIVRIPHERRAGIIE